MTFLNLFPISKKYERIISVLTFAVTSAMVVMLIRERTVLATVLAIVSAVILAASIFIRFRQRRESAVFFTQENLRLMEVKGRSGPKKYIRERLEILPSIRHPDIRLAANLNMCTVMLAGLEAEQAQEILNRINPKKLDDDALILVYWTQSLLAAIQIGDEDAAARAYQTAGGMIPDVNEALQNSFKPACIQYLLFAGDGQTALEILNEIPSEELDITGQDQLNALRAYALWITDEQDEARALANMTLKHDLLPSTSWWLKKIPR